MRKIHLLGLALFAVLAFSAVATTSALAAEELPVWLVNQATITEAIPALSETDGLSILLEDMGLGIDVLAGGTNEGQFGETVGGVFNPMLDLISKITVNSMEKDADPSNLCPTLVSVKAVNLPWLTELILQNGTIVDRILPDTGEPGTGNPGWAVECNTAIGKVVDTCTLAEGLALVENVTGEEEIVSKFAEPPTEPAECSGVIGAGAGLVEGEVLIFPENRTLKIAASDVVE